MTKAEIMTKMTRTFHKAAFKIEKYSPEILLATGIVGTVASAVMACKATTKVSEILEDSKAQIDTIHEVAENPMMEGKYTEDDAKKDLTIVYAQTALKVGKIYAPAVIVGAASIACILTSNNIMRKRNLAIAAAYATVDKSFKNYRSRVVDRFGEAMDRELRYNIRAQEIDEIVVNENGESEVVKKTVEVAEINMHDEFARIFDDGCIGWEKSPEQNLYFVICQQNYANDILKTRGHLLLNEVYDMFGFPRTRAGATIGWVYDPKNPDCHNFVDFGVHDIDNERKRAFVNGYERSIILDFNVDGNVWDLMS